MFPYYLCFLVLTLSISSLVYADTSDDPWDLSFYQKGAALGDSYTAGIGAGNMLEYWCSRYDGSYSNLVAQQLQSPNLDFSFAACSGAVIADVRKQAKKLSTGQEFVIVSAGGNDANLVGILNACVYSFYGGLYHPDCDSKLDDSSTTIQSSDFSGAVSGLINDITPSLASGGKIYYVGYAKFFDTSDNACDSVSWHVWLNIWTREFLTQARRQRMNDLVDALNGVLKSVISQAGDQVVFIDYDSYLDWVGGRYCQPGQAEASGASANRDQLFFYEMKTVDSPWLNVTSEQLPHDELKRRDSDSDDEPENGTLGEQLGALIMAAIGNSTDVVAALQDDNADNDLEDEVLSEEAKRLRRRDELNATTAASSFSRSNQPSGLSSGYSVQQITSSSVRWSNTTQSAYLRSLVPSTSSISEFIIVPSQQVSSRLPGTAVSSLQGGSGLTSEVSTLTSTQGTASSVTQLTSKPSFTRQPAGVRASGNSSDVGVTASSHPVSREKLSSTVKMFTGSASASSSARKSNASSMTRTGSYASRSTGPSPPYPFPNATWTTNSSSNIISNISGLGTLYGSTELGASVTLRLDDGSNSTTNGTDQGTVVSNSTHVVLANGNITEKSILRKLLVSDNTARVFHPTQYGHAIIANMILFQMAADRAKVLSMTDFPSVNSNGTGQGWLDPVGMACKGDTTDVWAARDPLVSAVDEFCEDPLNMIGQQGRISSGVYNHGTLDYVNVSIAWDTTSNLTEQGCKNWLGAVADGCDVPTSSSNIANLKHGGLVQYGSTYANATLNIQPLVVRREWDGGKLTSGQQCGSMDANTYLDRATLTQNIVDYCKAFEAHGIGAAGETFSMIYNNGTPDRVELSTTWPNGPREYQTFEDECVYYMSMISDGCSVPDSSKNINPMNWKYGGYMKDNNLVEYKIEPIFTRHLAPTSPSAGCKASYQTLYYSVSVWGWGFANSDFGQQSLLPALQRCGVTTGWQFSYYATPDPDGTEWMATAALPISIGYNCLGWAVGQAGGPELNC